MALVGFGATDSSRSCGCSSMRGFGISPDGLGGSPDGLGEGYVAAATDKPVISGTVTGNSLFDAVLGAGLGYAMSPKSSTNTQDMLYAAAGAAALGLVGLPGMLGLVALSVAVKASTKSNK